MKYICSKCSLKMDVSTKKAKCDCGGLWKLDFKPPQSHFAFLVDTSILILHFEQIYFN